MTLLTLKAGFATETNANDDRSTENQFVTMAKNLVAISKLKVVAMLVLPNFLLHWLAIDNFLSDEPFNYLTQVVSHILDQRRAVAANTAREKKAVDLLQLMLDAQVDEAELNTVNYDRLTITEESGDALVASEKNKFATNGKQKSLTEEEIVANCLIFFIGGFETTQSMSI